MPIQAGASDILHNEGFFANLCWCSGIVAFGACGLLQVGQRLSADMCLPMVDLMKEGAFCVSPMGVSCGLAAVFGSHNPRLEF